MTFFSHYYSRVEDRVGNRFLALLSNLYVYIDLYINIIIILLLLLLLLLLL